jgi:hypothetical protein
VGRPIRASRHSQAKSPGMSGPVLLLSLSQFPSPTCCGLPWKSTRPGPPSLLRARTSGAHDRRRSPQDCSWAGPRVSSAHRRGPAPKGERYDLQRSILAKMPIFLTFPLRRSIFLGSLHHSLSLGGFTHGWACTAHVPLTQAMALLPPRSVRVKADFDHLWQAIDGPRTPHLSPGTLSTWLMTVHS